MRNKVVANSGDVKSYLASVGVTEADYADIKNHGLSLDEFAKIVRIIKQGVSVIDISRPMQKEEVLPIEELPVADLPEGMVYSKFTPSSGAASRMFQALVETLKALRDNEAIPPKHQKSIDIFISGLTDNSIQKFAFLNELKTILAHKAKVSLSELIELINRKDSSSNKALETILEFVLEEKGLNYSNKPKALISFHKNAEGRAITALEEQMIEAFKYGQAKLHLTVSEEHMAWYEVAVGIIKKDNPILEEVEVTYSFQEKSTDSPGLREDGQVFRDKSGKIKFFPAGHGSLVNNLLRTPTCIIRNIDNVPNPESSKNDVQLAHEKMLKALVFFNEKLKTIYEGLIEETLSGKEAEEELLQLMVKYKLNLFMDIKKFADATDNQKIGLLLKALNRPLRILGVVKNEGEPGGGPFYVVIEGIPTVSIVEKDELRTPAQIDMMKQGAFFNPVDIVLSSLDINGQPFQDLTPFVDEGRWFVVEKTDKETGMKVRRAERPGLWNGGMGRVNTITVELPISTFGPVKEVNELNTRNQHKSVNQENK